VTGTLAPVSRTAELLRQARRDGYAIPAFNAVNLETAQAIVRAAELERAPVILQISQNAARYGGLTTLAAVARDLRRAATVPVILHFDHAETPQDARDALEQGFDMVMLEGDDVEALSDLAALAHAMGASLEAEYEVVAKGERASTRSDLEGLVGFTTRSGCDALAVSIGSRHKQSAKTSRLDFVRLEQIAAMTPLPLVLHGASGVSESDLRRAVQGGVTKVNVATELAACFTDAVRECLSADANLNDPRAYLGSGREAMTTRARAIMRALGSSNRVAA
jgi:fructose-bisphosphate aldolase, class II